MTKPTEKKSKDKTRSKGRKSPEAEPLENREVPEPARDRAEGGKENPPSREGKGEDAPSGGGGEGKDSSRKSSPAGGKAPGKKAGSKSRKAKKSPSLSKKPRKGTPAGGGETGRGSGQEKGAEETSGPDAPPPEKKGAKKQKSQESKKTRQESPGKDLEGMEASPGKAGGEKGGTAGGAGEKEVSASPDGAAGAPDDSGSQKSPEEPDDFARGLSPRTLEILAAARALKDRLGHGAVTTGHLIAAILEEEAGIARDVFWDINAYPDMFVEEMSRIKQIPAPESGYWFDERVALVLERARDGAEALGSPLVQPEHLALALLSLPDGPAAEILEEFSMDREDLKAEILAHMGVPVEECPDWEHETNREKSRRIRKQKSRK